MQESPASLLFFFTIKLTCLWLFHSPLLSYFSNLRHLWEVSLFLSGLLLSSPWLSLKICYFMIFCYWSPHPGFLSLCNSLNISAAILPLKLFVWFLPWGIFFISFFKYEPPLCDIWKGEQGFYAWSSLVYFLISSCSHRDILNLQILPLPNSSASEKLI